MKKGYVDMGFAKYDCQRAERKGFPEVIYCEGKTPGQVERITQEALKDEGPIILTRLEEGIYRRLKKKFPLMKYNDVARVAYSGKRKGKVPPFASKGRGQGRVLIISGGTSDIPVAEEAAVTCEVMGLSVQRLYDVGVCGIHRLLDKRQLLESADVIIVVAGMEGALASVVGGLTSRPLIAVPTSVGYGAAFGGLSALLTMLNSCAPGVACVNIDNGFGAGYFAAMIAGKGYTDERR